MYFTWAEYNVRTLQKMSLSKGNLTFSLLLLLLHFFPPSLPPFSSPLRRFLLTGTPVSIIPKDVNDLTMPRGLFSFSFSFSSSLMFCSYVATFQDDAVKAAFCPTPADVTYPADVCARLANQEVRYPSPPPPPPLLFPPSLCRTLTSCRRVGSLSLCLAWSSGRASLSPLSSVSSVSASTTWSSAAPLPHPTPTTLTTTNANKGGGGGKE